MRNYPSQQWCLSPQWGHRHLVAIGSKVVLQFWQFIRLRFVGLSCLFVLRILRLIQMLLGGGGGVL